MAKAMQSRSDALGAPNDQAEQFDCGSLLTESAADVADRASLLVIECGKVMAMWLDAQARVTVTGEDAATPSELVGVYSSEPGREDLYLMILEDLEDALRERALGKWSRSRP